MAKKYLSASVSYHSNSPQYAINADSIVTDVVINTQQPQAPGTDAAVGLPALFGEINGILSSTTKSTTITYTTHFNENIHGHGSRKLMAITIKINWPTNNSDGSMSYSGSGISDLITNGNLDFKDLSGPTDIDLYSVFSDEKWTPIKRYSIKLDLTKGAPQILSLPFQSSNATYLIETDDELSTPVQTVVSSTDIDGVKISELDETTSLNDNDLLVLSRDDPAGDSYDKSLKVEFKNFKSSSTNLAAQAVRGDLAADNIIGTHGTGTNALTSSESITLAADTYKILAAVNGYVTYDGSISMNVALEYELDESGTWTEITQLRSQKTKGTGSGHAYFWTISPVGLANFTAPSGGSYKFRARVTSGGMTIHDFSVIVLGSAS